MHGQFLAQLGTLAVAAATPASFPIRAPVSAVAANEAGAVALTADELRLMDATGFPLGRRGRPGRRAPARSRRPAGTSSGFASAAGVLGDDDFNDPHDVDSEIEDPENLLVEDDGPAHRRGRAGPVVAGMALAVGGGTAWVGGGDGLWRLSFAGSAERVALPAAGPIRHVAASADGRVIVAALDGAILRSDDGGARFQRLPEAPERVTRLAVTDGGQAYALAGQRLWQLGRGELVQTIPRNAYDVTACGSEALALVEGQPVVLNGLPPSRADEGGAAQLAAQRSPTVPPGAERVACSPDGALWVAYGAALWVSADGGRSWNAREDVTAASSIAAVAVTRTALWVASEAGLAVLPLREAASAPPAPSAGTGWPSDGGTCLPHWRWWLAALPRIDVGFATARSTSRRDVRAFVMLSFDFDWRREVRAERELEGAARAAERRAAVRPPAPVGQGWDALAMEERDAVARLLD